MGVQYSLGMGYVINVRGVRYSLGYRIHSDTPDNVPVGMNFLFGHSSWYMDSSWRGVAQAARETEPTLPSRTREAGEPTGAPLDANT